MHDADDQPPVRPAARADRVVEAAALAILIERHPEELTLLRLVDAMTVHTKRRRSEVKAIERAVAELVGVGLLHQQGARMVPTAAALRVAELDMGLG